MTDDFISTNEAQSRSTTVQEIEKPDGSTGNIKVAEATLGEIEEFEEQSPDNGDLETDVIQDIFDKYVKKPDDLDAHGMGMNWIDSIMRGVLKGWGVEDDELDEFIEDRSGN